jgi:hypothetical protein
MTFPPQFEFFCPNLREINFYDPALRRARRRRPRAEPRKREYALALFLIVERFSFFVFLFFLLFTFPDRAPLFALPFYFFLRPDSAPPPAPVPPRPVLPPPSLGTLLFSRARGFFPPLPAVLFFSFLCFSFPCDSVLFFPSAPF